MGARDLSHADILSVTILFREGKLDVKDLRPVMRREQSETVDQVRLVLEKDIANELPLGLDA